MKLRTFAERVGVRYETAWRWFKAGKIKRRQLDTGTIIVTEDFDEPVEVDVIVVVSARVSANENRPNLDTLAERLSASCAAKGWKVHKVVKEVGSGINDGRKKLFAILGGPTVKIIVVEHKDRLTRFGFKYIETLLAMQGRRIEVVNITDGPFKGFDGAISEIDTQKGKVKVMVSMFGRDTSVELDALQVKKVS